MTVTLKTNDVPVQQANSTALIPALAGSLAQLGPVIQQTQESMQQLVTKVTDALASSEERGRKLEAELIATKAQQATERVANAAKAESQQQLIDTMQKTVEALQKRMTILEENAKTSQASLVTLIKEYNGHNHGIGFYVTAGLGVMGKALQRLTQVAEPKFDEKKAS